VTQERSRRSRFKKGQRTENPMSGLQKQDTVSSARLKKMPRIQAHSKGMKSLLSDEVVAVRGVLTDTHPVDFHAIGVTGAIDRLALPLRERGTVVHLETPHHGMEVDRRSATLLYRAAQELLSNVYKFAQASAVTVRLGCVTQGMSHGVQLRVSDDGRGFDAPAAMTGRHTGMGLRLMRVAVVLAGGEMIIDSSAAAGTCVTVTLPLD
jgi:two-component system, NarL family, sensor histidine kinase UhpB